MNETRVLWIDQGQQAHISETAPPMVPQRARKKVFQMQVPSGAPPIPPRPVASVLRQSSLGVIESLPQQQFLRPGSSNESRRDSQTHLNRPNNGLKILASQPVVMDLNQRKGELKVAVNRQFLGPLISSSPFNTGLQEPINHPDVHYQSSKTGKKSSTPVFAYNSNAGQETPFNERASRPETCPNRRRATAYEVQSTLHPDQTPEFIPVNQLKLKFQSPAGNPQLQRLQNRCSKSVFSPSAHQPRRKSQLPSSECNAFSLHQARHSNVGDRQLRQQILNKFNAKNAPAESQSTGNACNPSPISTATQVSNLSATHDSGPTRESAVRQFFSDESFHLCILSKIVESCRNLTTQEPDDAAHLNALGPKRRIFCSQAVDELLSKAFFCFDALLAAQEKFVTTLQARLDSWTLNSCIGDLYMSIIEDRAVTDYANHLAASRQAAQRLANMPEFCEAFKISSSGGAADRPVFMVSCLELQRNEEISVVDLVGLPARWLVTHAENCKMLAQLTPADHPDTEHLGTFCQRLQVVFHEYTASGGCRRLLKQQLVVELVREKRKLRRLLLFNDVLVCTTQRAGSNFQQDWVLEEKWHMVKGSGVAIATASRASDEVPVSSIAWQQAVKAETRRRQEEDDLKSQIAQLQYEILQLKANAAEPRMQDMAEDKLRQLEAQLMLVVPNVELRLSQGQEKKRVILLLSSELDRREWQQLITDTLMTPNGEDDREGHLMPATKAELKDLLQAYSHLAWDTADLLKCLKRPANNIGGVADESSLFGTLCVTLHKLDVEDRQQPAHCRYSVATELKDLGRHFIRVHATQFHPSESGEVIMNRTFQLELSGCESDIRFLVSRHLSDKDQRSDIGCLELHLSKRDLRDYEYIAKCHYMSSSLLLTISLDYAPLQLSKKTNPSIVKQQNHLPVFGIPLDLLIRAEKSLMLHQSRQTHQALSTPGVPMLVQALVQQIDLNLNVEGLYRVSGSYLELQVARDKIDHDGPGLPRLGAFDSEADVSLHTGLLKLFLRELPDPLFTAELHKDLTAAAEADDKTLLRLLPPGRLPEANACTLLYLLGHLQRVSDNYCVNNMTPKNLSLILGPTLIQPQDQGGGGGVGGGDSVDVSLFVRQSQHQGKVLQRLMKLFKEGRLNLL